MAFSCGDEFDHFYSAAYAHATNLLLEKYHVETIIDCSADFGVRLRNPECAGALANSSTNANSAKQRHHQRSDRRLAGESTSGLGIRSRRYFHRYH
jgi:hypothetical protein